MCRDDQLIYTYCCNGVEAEGGDTLRVSKGGSDKGVVGGCETYIGIRNGVYSQRGAAYRQGTVVLGREGACFAEIRHQRWVAHYMVHLPVVFAQRRGGALNGHIAGKNHGTGGGVPLAVGLVVGVEQLVVHAHVAGVVAGVAGVVDVRTIAYRPVEVFRPVSHIAGTDVGHGAGIVVFAQQGFAQAGVDLHAVGEAAVAYHHHGLAVVGHLRHMSDGKAGSVP